MNNINAKISVLIVLTFAFCLAQAEEPYSYNELMASQYARWVSQIKSYEDVVELLPMSEKDKTLVSAEVKKSKVNFNGLKVSMIQPTKFEITSSDGSKVFVSFRQFNKSYLYINEKPLKLEAHKTFYNYQSEVDAILGGGENKAQIKFSLFEAAFAQNSKNTLRNVTASIGVSNGYVLFRGGLQKNVTAEPTPENLENVLIQAFKNESDRAKDMDRQHRRAAYFSAFSFTCSGGKLQTVEDKMLVQAGVASSLGMSKLQRIDDKTFRYTDNRCDVKISNTGKYKSGDLALCAIDTTDFYSGAPFFGYTLAASQCCKKTGCVEKVKVATARVTATHVNKVRKSTK